MQKYTFYINFAYLKVYTDKHEQRLGKNYPFKSFKHNIIP